MKERVDKFFKISERGSSVSTELIGGMTTFATMAYILVYMTNAMSGAGIDMAGILICTALTTAISCIAMGLYSNSPICLAPVLVIPNIAAGLIASGEATFGEIFGIFFWSGIVFLLISLFNLREMFARCLPKNMKIGLSAAVGMLIAKIGFNNCALITEEGNFKSLSDPGMLLSIIGIALALILTYVKIKINGKEYKIRGSLLIVIVLVTIIGIPLGVVQLPESIFTSEPLTSIGNVAFKIDLLGALQLKFIPFFLMFLINDFFGTMGSSLALAGKAKLLDDDGNFPAIGRVFLVDSSATILGSLFGITTISCFAESAAGIESGSRTGLSNISTAFFFLLCMFIAPIFLMIPAAATGAALIIIGISMLETLRDVDFNPVKFVPVAIMVLITAFMSDYVAGIAVGMLVYVVLQVLRALFSKDKEQIPGIPVWILAVLMALYFVFK